MVCGALAIPAPTSYHTCGEKERGMICEKSIAEVCGYRAFSERGEPERMTFPNGCVACSDKMIYGIEKGPCRETEPRFID